MSVRLVEHASAFLERRSSRRGFLVKSALVGSAMTVAPLDFVLRPGSAYAAVCRCGNPACGCGSACCDGYTEFCCTIHGSNTCPPGTFAGGWWKADGSSYCAGPRYYIDCHGECQCEACQPGGPAMCPQCDGLDCGCAGGHCGNRVSGCVTFRYGQCHQEIACAGRIACRVVTCTPAYLVDNACTATSMTDDFTAQHNAPCLQAPPRVVRAYGSATGLHGELWVCGPDGGVFAYGGTFVGSMAGRALNAPIVAMAGTPDGLGYWLVASDGGVFGFGSAAYHGSMGGEQLNAPIVAMAGAPDGLGYWLVASDGGVFGFGSARFFGSRSGQALSALAAGLVPTASGQGYWLWGQDGSVYAFGDAPFLGSYGGLAPAQRALPGGGVDAFYAMTARAAGYTLWAIAPLGPPPNVHSYAFGI